jgi:thiol-disulfide isomerase/thioredoxin
MFPCSSIAFLHLVGRAARSAFDHRDGAAPPESSVARFFFGHAEASCLTAWSPEPFLGRGALARGNLEITAAAMVSFPIEFLPCEVLARSSRQARCASVWYVHSPSSAAVEGSEMLMALGSIVLLVGALVLAFAPQRVLPVLPTRRARRLVPAGALVVAAGLVFAAGRLGDPAAKTAATAASAPCAGTSGACEAPSGDADGAVELPQGKPRLLEFESAHCAVCARMAPIIKDLEQRCTREPDTIVRVRVDDPRGQALAARYGVRFLPTFLGVDDRGEEVQRSVGEQPRGELARMIAEVRGEGCAASL